MDKKISHSCFVLVLLIMTHFHAATSLAIQKKNMLDAINACETVKFVNGSAYFEKCGELAYITDFKYDVADMIMCKVVYDITSKICAYNSQHPANEIQVPASAQEFKSLMKELEPKPNDKEDEFMEKLCKALPSTFSKLNNIGIASEPDILRYIDYAKKTLIDDKQCPYICHALKSPVNPLCMVLLWADKLFSSVKPLKISQTPDSNSPNVKDSATDVNVPVKENQEKPASKSDKAVHVDSDQQKSGDKVVEKATVVEKKEPLKQSPEQSAMPNDPQKLDDPAKAVDTSSKGNAQDGKK